MASLYSNELKAIVLQEDFLENPRNVMKENCQTIQHFDYHCELRRDETGEIYGVIDPVLLNFTLRLQSPAQARPYYNALASTERFRYSILFNATFDASQRLANYEDGMVAEGYVVSVEELSATKTAEGEDSQALLSVSLMLRSVTYLSSNRHLVCSFIK